MKKKNILPPTSKRVFLRTDPSINEEIRNQTIRDLNMLKKCDANEISDRIRSLELEWDTERVLGVSASLLILLSSYLGVKTSRIWFLLTGTVAVFMLWHSVLGWCPPLPMIRKWGVRTAEEISAEKTALKIMRGDFSGDAPSASDALNIAEK